MTALKLPSSTIDSIIDDPTMLGAHVSNGSSTTLQSLGISPATASRILDGYNSGFRTVFILNATLAAIATIVSVVMIHHKELTRGDEEQLREEARRHEKQAQYHDDPEYHGETLDMPELHEVPAPSTPSTSAP